MGVCPSSLGGLGELGGLADFVGGDVALKLVRLVERHIVPQHAVSVEDTGAVPEAVVEMDGKHSETPPHKARVHFRHNRGRHQQNVEVVDVRAFGDVQGLVLGFWIGKRKRWVGGWVVEEVEENEAV